MPGTNPKVTQVPGLPDEVPAKPLDNKFIDISACADGSKVYTFDVDTHVKYLIGNLRCLWKRNQLTDVMLLSEEKKTFRYHSVLLAATSEMFRTWFAGSQMQFYRGTLAPKNVTSAMLKALQDYTYCPDKVIEYDGDTESLHTFATHFELEDMAVSGILDTNKFIQALGEMYSSRSMAFGILAVGGLELPCHYALIAASMPYLCAQLTASDSAKEKGDFMYGTLPVDGVDPEAMMILLDYLYYARVEIKEETMLELLMAATKMRVLSVAKACCDFIQSALSVLNVLDCYELAKKAFLIAKDGFCKEIEDAAVAFIAANFHLVMQQDAFLGISDESLIIHFLSIADLSTIPLSDLISVIQSWCLHAPERNASLPGLISLLTILKNQKHFLQVLTTAGKSSNNQVIAVILAALKGKQPPKKGDGPGQGQNKPPSRGEVTSRQGQNVQRSGSTASRPEANQAAAQAAQAAQIRQYLAENQGALSELLNQGPK